MELSGKTIAIDVSIYLYKYESENALLENIYLMLSILRHYGIIPIFIFDGKAPPEKKDLLDKRKNERLDALEEFNQLKQKLESEENNDNSDDKETEKEREKEREKIESAMNALKRQIVQISKDKIETVKKLITAYGAMYYDAPGEADELCALLVIKNMVWACLSEDMDLFVYGCTRVLRYFSLIAHTVVVYDMEGILSELGMTQPEFKEVCILSGTDYNLNSNKTNLRLSLKYFNQFKQLSCDNIKPTFYEWISTKTNYISNINLLYKINDMFDLQKKTSSNILDTLNIMQIISRPKNHRDIMEIMADDGFIFVTQV